MSRRPDPRILEIKRRRAGTIAKSKRVMTMSRHLTLTRGVLADHLDGVGQYPCGGFLVSGERVHRHDPHTLAERLAAFLEPCGERLLAPAFDHVQQAGRPAFLPGRQVHDDGHIPTAERGVSPHVLVHADLLDPVALGATPCGGLFLVKSVFRVSSLIFFGFRHEECRPVVCFTGCPSCRT